MIRQINRLPLYLGLMSLVFLLIACDPIDPTAEPVNRVRQLNPEVRAGSPPNNPPVLPDNSWLNLIAGDVVRTDENGEAELDLANCNGSIYVFMDTNIQTNTCRRSEQASGLGLCGGQGTGYYNITCAAEFTVDTASAQIIVTGTSYAVTYLPENGMTLVIALEGSLEVLPVVDQATDVLGARISLKGSEFIYTTPGSISRELDGIPARTPQPIENIGPLINQFGLQRWMARVESRAQEDNLLPAGWPLREGEVVQQVEPAEEPTETPTEIMAADPPGPPPEGSVAMSFYNGPLAENRVIAAVLFSIDKEAALPTAFPNGDTQVVANLNSEWADIEDYLYDRERSIALLGEAGYLGEFTFAYVLIPLDDAELYPFSTSIRGYFAEIGIETELVFYSPLEVDFVLGEFQETESPIILLTREE